MLTFAPFRGSSGECWFNDLLSQVKQISPHNVFCVFWQKRFTEPSIWSADLVHLKGSGFWLCRSTKARLSV